jgi:hypothetical protein
VQIWNLESVLLVTNSWKSLVLIHSGMNLQVHSPSIQKEPKKHMHIVDAGCVSQELRSSILSSLSVLSLEATHCSGAGLHKLLGSHSLAHCSGAGLLASHSL